MQVLLSRPRGPLAAVPVPAAHTHLQAWGHLRDRRRSGTGLQHPPAPRPPPRHWGIHSILTSPPLDPPCILGGFRGGSPSLPRPPAQPTPLRGADRFNLLFLIRRKAPCGTGSIQGGFSSSQARKCPEGTDTDIFNLFLIKDKALPYVRELEKGEGLFFYSRLQAHQRGLEAWGNILGLCPGFGVGLGFLGCLLPLFSYPLLDRVGCETPAPPDHSLPTSLRRRGGRAHFLGDASNSVPITSRIPQNLGLGRAREEAALHPAEGSSLSPIPNDQGGLAGVRGMQS